MTNARDNYRTVMAGGKPLEPPGPLANIGLAIGRVFGRRPATSA